MRVVKAGTADISVVIRIIDSTDGTPETGVVFNTAGIDLEYRREGAVSVDIVEVDLATPLLTDPHLDGGFLHIGNGYYRLDLPDAACAAGVTGVLVHGIVTGMVVIGEYIQLVAYDPFDAVRLGLTALPNAAADGAGGLPISDTGGLDMDAIPTSKTGYALSSTGADLILKTSTFALAMADSIWDEVLTGATHNVPSSAGRRLRQLEAAVVLSEGTAQAGGGNDEIILEVGENANNDWYNHTLVVLTGGTGAGQARHIHDYDGATITAEVYPDWVTNPAADTTYEIRSWSIVHVHEIETTALAQINTEVDTALSDIKLDHLVAVVDSDDPVNDSIVAKMAATGGDWSTFVKGTDSLQSIRDVAPHGSAMVGTNGANTTVPDAAGTAAALHAITDALIAALNDLSAGQVNAEVVDVINVDALVAGVTVAESLRRVGAITSGIISGAGTGTETFKDYAASVNTIVVTVDASGNRSVITYN